MSDIVPYYFPVVTKAARDKRTAAQRHDAELERARSDARVFEYRAMEGVDITNAYILGISRLDRNLTANCGDRPGLEMELRTLIQNLNGAYAMGVARFMQGRP